MFNTKVLKRVYGSKWDEVTGEWKILHNKELHRLCDAPDITNSIKLRRLIWACHICSLFEGDYILLWQVGEKEAPEKTDTFYLDKITHYLLEVGVSVIVHLNILVGASGDKRITGVESSCPKVSEDVYNECFS